MEQKTSCLNPKIWEIVPNKIEKLASLNPFKNGIKNGNLAIVLIDYVKNTFRMSVSCNLAFFNTRAKKGLLTNVN